MECWTCKSHTGEKRIYPGRSKPLGGLDKGEHIIHIDHH